MLKDYEGDVLDLLPDPIKSLKATIKFEGPMPTGIFERFISEIVRKSGQFEGSEGPRLYRNYADVGFGTNMVHSVLQKCSKTIHISTARKDGEDHMRRVITFASEIVQGLLNSLLGEQFKPKILVEAEDENEIVICELEVLWNVLKNAREKIIAVTPRGRKISVPTAVFSAYYPEASGVFSPAIKIGPKKTLPVTLEDETNDKPLKCCVFLVHEWGTASTGHKTHNKVLAIKEKLERRGFDLWVHENFGDVFRLDELLTDAQLSRRLVIFLSRRYMERVMDPDNDVGKQFPYWMKFFPKKYTMVAILEETLLNMDTWFGPITQCNIGDVYHLDFSTTERVSKNFDKLVTALTM